MLSIVVALGRYNNILLIYSWILVYPTILKTKKNEMYINYYIVNTCWVQHK